MLTDENLRPDAKDQISALIERIEAHEGEGSAIQVRMELLGLDAKRVKTIRKAKADADAAQKTLNALMEEGLISDPAQVAS